MAAHHVRRRFGQHDAAIVPTGRKQPDAGYLYHTSWNTGIADEPAPDHDVSGRIAAHVTSWLRAHIHTTVPRGWAGWVADTKPAENREHLLLEPAALRSKSFVTVATGTGPTGDSTSSPPVSHVN